MVFGEGEVFHNPPLCFILFKKGKNMKKLLLLSAVICAFSANAYSMDIKPYIEGKVSESYLREKYHEGRYSDFSFADHLILGGSVEVGARLDQFRLGLEGYYNDTGKDNVYEAKLKFKTKGTFLNVYYDIPPIFENMKQLKPYIGAGIGYSALKMGISYSNSSEKHSLKDKDWGLNAGFGVSYGLNDHTELTLGYRYEKLGEVKQDYYRVKVRYVNNKVAFGLRYTF